jgi:hypothetical protein
LISLIEKLKLIGLVKSGHNFNLNVFYSEKYRRKITLKPRTDQVPVVANRVRFLTLSGLVSDCCSTPNEQFFSYIMARKNNIMMSAFDERIYIGKPQVYHLLCVYTKLHSIRVTIWSRDIVSA